MLTTLLLPRRAGHGAKYFLGLRDRVGAVVGARHRPPGLRDALRDVRVRRRVRGEAVPGDHEHAEDAGERAEGQGDYAAGREPELEVAVSLGAYGRRGN